MCLEQRKRPADRGPFLCRYSVVSAWASLLLPGSLRLLRPW